MKPSLILRSTTRLLLPLLLLFSVFILLRGHNEPGGGFIGGLLAAGAVSLVALAEGPAAARRVLRCNPVVILGVGLLLALASGLPALATGAPYLTGLWSKLSLPGIGKLSTVLLFDIGVYLVVAGTALLMVLNLAEAPARTEDTP